MRLAREARRGAEVFAAEAAGDTAGAGAGAGDAGDPQRRQGRFEHDDDLSESDLDGQLVHLFHHCAHLLVHRQNRAGGRTGTLVMLLKHGPMSQRALAERLNVRAATLSEQIAKLEAEGLVRRAQNVEDKRSVTVSLSETGDLEARQALRERSRANEGMFSPLSREEKLALFSTLEKLVDHWHTSFDRKPGEAVTDTEAPAGEADASAAVMPPRPGHDGRHHRHQHGHGEHGGHLGHGKRR